MESPSYVCGDIEINTGTLSLTKLRTLFGFHASRHLLFLSQDPVQGIHCIQLSCFLSLFWSVTDLSFSLLCMTLTVLRSPGQVFCRICFFLCLFDVFLMIRLELWVWRKRTTQAKCPSHHIRSGLRSSISLTLIMWLRCYLPFLH